MADILGMPLILHVVRRCQLCRDFDEVAIATCDTEIADAADAAGILAIMTADSHERATDRVEEAAGQLSRPLDDDDLVVMVQGDEVLMNPSMAEAIIEAYVTNRSPVVNLASRLYDAADHDDPNNVKVVGAPDGRALYFSRAPIPSRARAEGVPMYQQTGVMGFSFAFLNRFSDLPQTPLEKMESVDMLRVVEHGMRLDLVYTDTETLGVDVPTDIARAEQKLRDDPFTPLYMKV